jgi:hypothetical protein
VTSVFDYDPWAVLTRIRETTAANDAKNAKQDCPEPEISKISKISSDDLKDIILASPSAIQEYCEPDDDVEHADPFEGHPDLAASPASENYLWSERDAMPPVQNNPTEEQVALLAELAILNQQWAEIHKLEQEGGVSDDVDAQMLEAQCGSISGRACEIWETLTAQNPALLESTYYLEPDN